MGGDILAYARRGHGHGRFFQRLISPEVFRFVAPVRPIIGQAAAGRDQHTFLGRPGIFLREYFLGARGVGPRRAGSNPRTKVVALGGGEGVVVLRRHRLPDGVNAGDGEVERTGLGFAGDERGFDAVAALERAGEGAEIESALDFFFVATVARETFVLQHGQHAADEERFVVGGGRRRRRPERRGEKADQAQTRQAVQAKGKALCERARS